MKPCSVLLWLAKQTRTIYLKHWILLLPGFKVFCYVKFRRCLKFTVNWLLSTSGDCLESNQTDQVVIAKVNIPWQIEFCTKFFLKILWPGVLALDKCRMIVRDRKKKNYPFDRKITESLLVAWQPASWWQSDICYRQRKLTKLNIKVRNC